MALVIPEGPSKDYYDSVIKKCEERGLLEAFKRDIQYLEQYGEREGEPPRYEVHLFSDFAPLSFIVHFHRRMPDGSYKYTFNGGFIFYEGSQSGVGGPQFSVSLSALNGDTRPRWELNT